MPTQIPIFFEISVLSRLRSRMPSSTNSQKNMEVVLMWIRKTRICGYWYDIDRKAVIAAQQNAKEAGLDEYIQFRRSAVELIEPPPEMKGIVICNPPYGARLGEVDALKDVYRNLGFILKTKFKGWVAW